jgi:DNA-binding transcriptional regulator GbsR (MarR family)
MEFEKRSLMKLTNVARNLNHSAFVGAELERLEDYFNEKELSLRKLADMAKVTKSTVQRALRGAAINDKNFAKIQFVVEKNRPYWAGDEPAPIKKERIPSPREISKRLAMIQERVEKLDLTMSKALQRITNQLERMEMANQGTVGVSLDSDAMQRIAEDLVKTPANFQNIVENLQENGQKVAETHQNEANLQEKSVEVSDG